MPNRIIKDSICTSDTVAEMTDFEFRLWVGLITQADDAGRGDARPAIIKGRVFPLRERVTVSDIDKALHGLAAKGCASLYTVGGKPYFWFPTWELHQRVRDVKPKYPSPDEADNPGQSAADCGELRRVAAGCGLNPIQSEYNPNPEGKRARARFTPPTEAEVRAYCADKEICIDVARFMAHYTSNGWKVGVNPMQDWKASVDGWAARDAAEKKAPPVKMVEQQGYAQREYTDNDDALDAMMASFAAEKKGAGGT